MTFWDFFEILITRVKQIVDLPGNWPYGVFGRDPTEGLIQYGSASVAAWVDGTMAQINIKIPGTADRTFQTEMSEENAERIGDDVGRLFAANVPPP